MTKQDMYLAIDRCADRLGGFTADDVWEELGGVTGQPSALGPVFLQAERDGVISRTGESVPRRHRELIVWKRPGAEPT
jgi:hypothetical protein